MPLAPSSRLGPYEILAALGAGGMGEVYRARDTRLSREVAVKVLPAALASDPDRLARFEREAKAVAALSHPNILAIHDFGLSDGTSYVVTELVPGETLRDRLAGGPLPVGKSIAIAIQLANGLAAAHDKQIVHRDLKPDNVMLLPDGQVKILDFGLAKQAPFAASGSGTPGSGSAAAAGSSPDAGTMTQGTDAGTVLGTAGYMSPEQVRGSAVDGRSDIFSLGAVIHEMISGQRAFRGESPADTISAILREEPPPLAALGRDVPSALDRILGRCLEKRPEERFRSAHDLALALEAISTISRADHAAAAAAADTRSAARRHPSFRRLTFRNGNINTARFADGGSSVVYGAAWEGKPFSIFSSRPESPEARDLGLPPADLQAVSASGDLAISLGHRCTYWFMESGTLARTSLGGGGVRLLQDGVTRADWSPDGRTLAIVRQVEGRFRIEYPAGKTIYETEGWIKFARVSRDGTRVAFSEHPVGGDTRGSVWVVDRDGRRTLVADGFAGTSGVCWSPDGKEVWFSGIDDSLKNAIGAAVPGEAPRVLYVSPVRIRIHDAAPNGRVLVTREGLRLGAVVGEEGKPGETELAWFDGSLVADLSRDGSILLFSEAAEAENPAYAVYIRPTDGSAAVRLGEGTAMQLSPDGTWALALTQDLAEGLVLYPTGLGEVRSIESPGIVRYQWAGWHPNGRDLLFVGSTAERARRLYRQPVAGGPPQMLLDEELEFDWITGFPISPDGARIVVRRADGSAMIMNIDAGTSEPLGWVQPGDVPVQFDRDGASLFVARTTDDPPRIERVNLATGARSLWRELRPPEPAGIIHIGAVVVAPEVGRYAYSYLRSLSDLYMVEGIG